MIQENRPKIHLKIILLQETSDAELELQLVPQNLDYLDNLQRALREYRKALNFSADGSSGVFFDGKRLKTYLPSNSRSLVRDSRKILERCIAYCVRPEGHMDISLFSLEYQE